MSPTLKLDTPIQYLKGVGPIMAKRLKKLDITTLADLLYHFPHRHEDRSHIKRIANLHSGESATIIGTIISAKNIFTKRGKRIQKAVIADESGQIEATWFNQTYIIKTLQQAQRIAISGQIDTFGNKPTFVSPDFEVVKTPTDSQPAGKPHLLHTARIIPIYPETAGVSSKWLRTKIQAALSLGLPIPDWLPAEIHTQENLIGLLPAIQAIHFPPDQEALAKAKKRLAFDELFLLQLASQQRKYYWQHKKLSHPLIIDQEKVSQLINHLPFTLTAAQNQALKTILSDLKQKSPMNRLLQGDVGSGKTVVAALAMYVSYLNGFRSALMAPTEILANQHFATLKTILEPAGLKLALITSASKPTNNTPHTKYDLFVGTHALLHRELPPDIALLVVDEQHRFGVEQRAQLLKAPHTPHLLSMTATPIPRTVALTLYAELDLSVIDEMPHGRKPVKTWLVPAKKRANAYQWIADQIDQHQAQAFVVCPLIEESDADTLSQVKAAETEYEHLRTNIFPQLRLGLLHGRMKSADKAAVIAQFSQQKIDVLVSTPVIEVGIDIPNASIILIEAAERFGLAQLHQLRGRVGRGDRQSYCLMFPTADIQQDTHRLKALETNHSGFKLANIDLKLRGPGEMYGTKQHGFSRLKIASFSDQTLITATHTHAQNIIKQDPELANHPRLAAKLQSLLSKQVEPN